MHIQIEREREGDDCSRAKLSEQCSLTSWPLVPQGSLEKQCSPFLASVLFTIGTLSLMYSLYSKQVELLNCSPLLTSKRCETAIRWLCKWLYKSKWRRRLFFYQVLNKKKSIFFLQSNLQRAPKLKKELLIFQPTRTKSSLFISCSFRRTFASASIEEAFCHDHSSAIIPLGLKY